MEIVNIKIKDLKPAEYNPREIDEEELDSLKKSLEEFSFVEPAVVNKDYTIIGGHQRVRAAESLGWTEVPCFIVDLDKTKEKMLNLALNKISGRWNEEKLMNLITELDNSKIDFSKTGFSDLEIQQFLIQYEIAFSDDDVDFSVDEELKRIFERQERVEIPVNEPNVIVKKDKLGFYCSTMEEYKMFKNEFSTNRKGQLDVEKIKNLLKK